MRNLYDKYMKMEQDCQTSLNIAKEWQNKSDRLQEKLEGYRKVMMQLERDLKIANGKLQNQAHRTSVNTSEYQPETEHSEDLFSSDALMLIKKKYPLQTSSSQTWQGN